MKKEILNCLTYLANRVSEKDALLALDAARNEMLDKICSYLFREEYVSPEFVRRLYEANCVYQPF